ncbi:hypothetical protein C5609_23155 [Pseudomonas putida]|uniref:hypothetical protein n=1 Tax=Pseudomonas putida TaxID=303 RepID=UPI00107035ED|nr:hypothetical protein [Pseudomonas putida]TFF49538.1 hypothetical protein C5609_23155 [Pseudomonas putida]
MPVEKKPAWPDHFRYIDSIGPEGVTIVCRRYVVVRKRQRGLCHGAPGSHRESLGQRQTSIENSWRRFAYPRKEEALSSYKARKRQQLSHAELALERAKAALADIKDLEAINDEHLCAGGDYIRELNWVDC